MVRIARPLRLPTKRWVAPVGWDQPLRSKRRPTNSSVFCSIVVGRHRKLAGPTLCPTCDHPTSPHSGSSQPGTGLVPPQHGRVGPACVAERRPTNSSVFCPIVVGRHCQLAGPTLRFDDRKFPLFRRVFLPVKHRRNGEGLATRALETANAVMAILMVGRRSQARWSHPVPYVRSLTSPHSGSSQPGTGLVPPQSRSYSPA